MAENLPAMRETQVQSLCREDPLLKGMAAVSSILAWRLPWARLVEETAGPRHYSALCVPLSARPCKHRQIQCWLFHLQSFLEMLSSPLKPQTSSLVFSWRCGLSSRPFGELLSSPGLLPRIRVTTTVSLRTLARGQEMSGGGKEAMGKQEHQKGFFQRLERATVFPTGKTYLKGRGGWRA